MLQFLATSAPFFAVIALGALVSGRGVFGAEAVRVLNVFAFYVATPAMIVKVMAAQPIAALWNGPFLLVLAVIGVATMFAGLMVARRLGLRYGAAITRGQSLVGGNFTFLGIPLMLAFLGETRAASPVAMALLIDQALITPLTIGLLDAGRGEGGAGAMAWRLARGTIVNPFMLSILAGLAVSIGGFGLPGPVDRFLAFLGASAAPVGIFALGIAAGAWGREKLEVAAIAPLVLGKLLMHPLIVFLAMTLCGFDQFWVTAGVLYAAVPIAANVFVIAEQFGGDARVAAPAIVASTALAALTFPAIAWLVSQ